MRRKFSSKSRTVSMDAAVYRGEGETETEIEVEVSGMLEPYFAGSWDDPPSGGGVDDIRAIFLDGKKHRDIELTDEELTMFADQLVESSIDDDDEPEYEPPDDWDDRPDYD